MTVGSSARSHFAYLDQVGEAVSLVPWMSNLVQLSIPGEGERETQHGTGELQKAAEEIFKAWKRVVDLTKYEIDEQTERIIEHLDRVGVSNMTTLSNEDHESSPPDINGTYGLLREQDSDDVFLGIRGGGDSGESQSDGSTAATRSTSELLRLESYQNGEIDSVKEIKRSRNAIIRNGEVVGPRRSGGDKSDEVQEENVSKSWEPSFADPPYLPLILWPSPLLQIPGFNRAAPLTSKSYDNSNVDKEARIPESYEVELLVTMTRLQDAMNLVKSLLRSYRRYIEQSKGKLLNSSCSACISLVDLRSIMITTHGSPTSVS